MVIASEAKANSPDQPQSTSKKRHKKGATVNPQPGLFKDESKPRLLGRAERARMTKDEITRHYEGKQPSPVKSAEKKSAKKKRKEAKAAKDEIKHGDKWKDDPDYLGEF